MEYLVLAICCLLINHVLQLSSLSPVLSTSEADVVFVKDIQKTIEAVKKVVTKNQVLTTHLKNL